MLIFAIDDELKTLQACTRIIREAKPDAEVFAFQRANKALEEIRKKNIRPDAVFCDIRMPGLSGLEFAIELKKESPFSKIIFMTGYEEYAVDAFRLHAQGYILKPLEKERVSEELELLNNPYQLQSPGLQVRCFGYFEVFFNGEPLSFNRRKAKELFAYLIDRNGDACTMEEISAVLWEDESDISHTKNRIRVLISDLRVTLASIGQEDLMIRKSGWVSLRRSKVDCDYYRMLDGDITALNSYHGEYMNQYSWAEFTAGKLWAQRYDL